MFQGKEEFLLKNINYIDVINKSSKIKKNIVVKNGFIAQIFDSSRNITNKTVFDCTNLWAIPSFIDTHVHLSFNPFLCDDVSNNIAIYSNLTDAVLSGTCLVRDLGSNKELTKSIIQIQQQNKLCFPEIITAGTPLCVDSGHGHDYGVCINIEKINDWLYQHKEEGHSWVKIMNDPENHSQYYLELVVSIAHKIGLKVACHAFTPIGIKSAISSGVDTVEHSLPYDNYCLSNSANIYFVPTAFSAWTSIRDEFQEQVSEKEKQYLVDWYKHICENISKSYINNCNLATGTDGGCAPSRLSDIKNEVKFLYKHGISPMQCLCASTINAAKMLGKENLYGSISVGKYANIIVLKNNPLKNINALDETIAIWLRGTTIKNEVTFI